jgi:MFS family permease
MSVLPADPLALAPAQSRTWRWLAWVQVVLAALAMVATLPGRSHGLGMITERLLVDLRLERVTYAAVNLWATLAGAAFCLPIGVLIERFGVRRMLTGVVLGLGAVVLLMCQVSRPLAENVSAMVSGTLAPETVLVGLLFMAVLLTRGLGQSALSVISLAQVGKWFERRLSIAMGVFSVLVGIGFTAAFRAGGAVSNLSWQAVWAGIGWAVLAFAPLAWLLARDSPEACGLAPDGRADATAEPTGMTVGQALATPAFWIFGLASSLYGLIAAGVSLFNESILKERGFGTSTYYSVMMATALVTLVSNFVGGWVLARWSISRLMSVAMLVLALALFGLPFVSLEQGGIFLWTTTEPGADGVDQTFPTVLYPQLIPYVLAMGLSGGIVTVVFFTIWGHAYGRLHLGKIQGVAQMLTVLASAIGPLLLAASKQAYESYVPMFYTLAGVAAAFGVAAWLTPVPRAVPATLP